MRTSILVGYVALSTRGRIWPALCQLRVLFLYCFVQSGRMASTLATNNFVFPVGDTSLLATLHVLLLLYVMTKNVYMLGGETMWRKV